VGINDMIAYCMQTGQIKVCQFAALQQCELDEEKTELLKQYLGHGEV